MSCADLTWFKILRGFVGALLSCALLLLRGFVCAVLSARFCLARFCYGAKLFIYNLYNIYNHKISTNSVNLVSCSSSQCLTFTLKKLFQSSKHLPNRGSPLNYSMKYATLFLAIFDPLFYHKLSPILRPLKV